MPLRLDGPAQERTLLGIIRHVRRRWRFKLLLRGGALAGGAALAMFLLSSWVLDRTGFSPGVLFASRVVGYGIVLWLLFQYLLRPLSRRVTDERVAMYLEEHEPELHELVLSGLELERRGEHSPLARRTVERALEQCHRLQDGRILDKREINRFGSAFASVTVIALLLAILQPALLRQGAGALLNPLKGAAASDPYSIEVEPGNVTIARGADQSIRAQLRGFAAADAEVVVRTGSDSSFQRVPMFAGADSGRYEVLLFDVNQPTEYFVEAGGIRSAVYRIEVADLPYVKALALEYRYPEYTGRPPERIEDGGDVAALRGTMVYVYATTTLPAKGGTLVLSTGQKLPLRAQADGTLSAAFRVEQQGFYHLEFTAMNGQVVNGSPEYTIDVLPDRAPSVRFSKPGRDTRPTITDEVFLETQAEDDYGVGGVDLYYSVNGAQEKRIELFRSEHGPTEITAGHTLYLEELGLQPGDIVSYYARAKDASGSGREVTSDIYFLTMRPFGRDYRQAESGQAQPGQQGQQGQGDNPGELTQQQREIVAATFNLVRDSAQYTADAFKEYVNTIALMQDRLRQQVQTLAQRMRNRQVTQDTMFAKIAEELPGAAAVMDTVLAQLRGRGPRPAISPEQRALQRLERAEALYREVQVQLQQQGGGGGGGGSPNASDLADLFELELDKLRNQYETVQRGERQQSEQQVDAELEKLRELARRLQQENERQRRLAMQGGQQQAGGSGGNSQRQLAEQLEQAARQLQRLAREQPQQQDLERAARELEQAADALRRNAAEARNGNSAGTQQALERVNEATRRLQGQRGSGLQREAQQALERAQRLADQQRETGDRMERASEPGSPTAQARDELIRRRTEQLSQTQQLEQEIDRLAAGTRREQRDASRRLQQAADQIRDSNLKEMQSFSRNLMRDRASPDMVRQFENRMDQAMDSVIGQLQGAVGAFTQSDDQRVAQGLERAAELARGLESMRERTRQQQEQARASGQGERGQQQAQAGQQGRQGERGRQQGQPGQQQGQPGQRQGQAGQQGQQGQQQGGQQGGAGQLGDRRGQTQAGGQAGGGPLSGAAGGRVRPGLNPDQARQLRAEARERLAEAEALRRELRQEGQDVAQLEEVMQSLRGLDREGIYADAAKLQLLQTQAAENMKAFEFALRRALLGDTRDKLYLTGSDEVPEGYRKLVEEYYRGLARRR